jgi:hypothetical protein
MQPHPRPIATTLIATVQLRLAGDGQPLERGIRRAMEQLFQADFSAVRVHLEPAARAIGAEAFTIGDAIHFAPGRYNPATPEGRALIGHELAHVVQQRHGRVANPYGRGVAIVQDPVLEAEANAMGQSAADAMRAGPRIGGLKMLSRLPFLSAPPPANRQPVPRRAAIQRMEAASTTAPSADIDVDTGPFTETDRQSIKAILEIPFYRGVVGALLAGRSLTVRATRDTDTTNRALWDGTANEIRIRPEVTDPATRRELIKWEMLNGWRRFDISGIDATTGPVRYADLVEAFEYGTAKLFAEHWSEEHGTIFEWTKTLQKDLTNGTEMTPEQWVEAIRRNPNPHYKWAQQRYLYAYGTVYLLTEAGLQWLASPQGAWFLRTSTWTKLSEKTRATIQDRLRPYQQREERAQEALGDEIAELLKKRRAAKAKPATPTPLRSPSRSPPRHRPTSIDRIRVSVRQSNTYRDRLLINSLTIVYERGGSQRETPADDGPLGGYYRRRADIKRDVASAYRVRPGDVDLYDH